MLGCLSPCVVACTLRLTWPFLWSCGWSILYVSSVLLLHDSLHSLFTPVCLSVTRQGAWHVLKGIPQLVIPSSQGWGGQIFPSRQHMVFFFGAFLFVTVLFLYELKKRTRPASSYGHVESLHVYSLEPFDTTNCACLALQTTAV